MKSILAFLLALPLLAQARVQLDLNCQRTLKDGNTTSVVTYGHQVLDSEKANSQMVQDFTRDEAFYSTALNKTGELQGGGEAFRLVLSRVEDDQKAVFYGKKPKIKGETSSSASVQENGGIVSTVWLNKNKIDKRTKKPTLENTFPAQLKIAYTLKTGVFARQKIEVSCEIRQKSEPIAAKRCEGEAQIGTGEIVSTKYIEGVGCKAVVDRLYRVESNVMCSATLFDVDIAAEGLVITPPSSEGCTAKAGDHFSGVAERHGEHIYLFNPSDLNARNSMNGNWYGFKRGL